MMDSRKYQSQEQDPEACISEWHALLWTNYKHIVLRHLWHVIATFVFITIKRKENRKARATSFLFHLGCSPLSLPDEDYMKH